MTTSTGFPACDELEKHIDSTEKLLQQLQGNDKAAALKRLRELLHKCEESEVPEGSRAGTSGQDDSATAEPSNAPSSIEERLASLEKQLGQLRKEKEDLKSASLVVSAIPLKRGRGRPRKYPRLEVVATDIPTSQAEEVEADSVQAAAQTDKPMYITLRNCTKRINQEASKSDLATDGETGDYNTDAADADADDFPALLDHSEPEDEESANEATPDEGAKSKRSRSGPRGPHKKINRHVCQVCHKAFTHGRPFNRHLLKHDPGALCCRRCREEFYNEAVFLSHQCTATAGVKRSRTEHRCRVCEAVFPSFKKLNHHLRQQHNQVSEPGYYCQYCQKGFVKKPSLYLHYREHAGDKHVCLKCGDFHDTEDDLEQHMKQHDAESSYKCEKCNYTFKRRQQYESHMQGHERYDCSVCSETFSQKKLLHVHMQTCHNVTLTEEAKEFPCDLCDKAFQRRSALEAHLKTHFGEETVRCEPCDKEFSCVNSLMKHQETAAHLKAVEKEPDLKNHLCATCGRTFPRKQALVRHMWYHTDKKRYSCPHCDYQCREQNNLKRHIDLHFSTRNFICEVCGVAFHTKKTLETHRIYKHSNDRSYPCPDCPQRFKTSSSLKRHRRSHSNQRPHKCTQCAVGFNRMYNLRRHMRSVHGSEQALPPVNRVKLLDAPEGLEYHKGPVALGLQGKPPQGPRKKAAAPGAPGPQGALSTGGRAEVPCQPIPQPSSITTNQNMMTASQPVNQNIVLTTQPNVMNFYSTQSYEAVEPMQPVSHPGTMFHLSSVQGVDASKWMFPAQYQDNTLHQQHPVEQHQQPLGISEQRLPDYTPAELYAAVPGLLHLMHSNVHPQSGMSQ